ncbi:MAG TPA: hypothetical protein VHP58_03490 [Alphaproteobacteria bacterium]|nr:hypothetical protein [Alphaproteobacteria bacterium]
MAGLLWKLLTSPNEQASAKIIMEAVRKKLKGKQSESHPDHPLWIKKEPEQNDTDGPFFKSLQAKKSWWG